jgi:hypothetical protein
LAENVASRGLEVVEGVIVSDSIVVVLVGGMVGLGVGAGVQAFRRRVRRRVIFSFM